MRSGAVAVLAALTLLCVFAIDATAAFKSYHIGNSLTWDTQPEKYPAADYHDSAGHHIKCSSALSSMLENPETTCVNPTSYGYFSQALPNNDWDAVTLQPYVGYSSEQELQSFVTMANMTGNDTEIFMYATWPWYDDVAGGFNEEWYAGADDVYSLDDPMIHRRSWYEFAMQQVRSDLPDREVNLIPVGDVFAALETELETGAYEGYSSYEDLYRDSRHASYGIGRYAAHMTSWAVMHKINPQLGGIDYWSDSAPVDLIDELLRKTVWEVISNDPYTGIVLNEADFNGDGIVDLADYTVWRNSLGATGLDPYESGDATGDGSVTVEDYQLWKSQLGMTSADASAMATIHAVNVPEPSALVMAVVGLGLVLWSRRRC